MHPLPTTHEADDILISQRQSPAHEHLEFCYFHHIQTTYSDFIVKIINNCPKPESLRVFFSILEKGLFKLSNYQSRSSEKEKRNESKVCLAG